MSLETTISATGSRKTPTIYSFQDFLGHRTHAELLEEELKRQHIDALVVRFSPRTYPGVARPFIRAAGLRLPGRLIRQQELDGWSLRAILQQSYVAQRVIGPMLRQSSRLYVHTHTAGLLATRLPRSVDVSVSLDGTVAAEARMANFSGPFTKAAMRLERQIFERANRIIAFSDWARSSVIEDYGVAASKVITIRNGVRSFLPTAPTNPFVETDLPLIGFVGNDFHRKGGDRILRVHQRHLRDDFHLVLVTAHPIDSASLRNVTVLRSVPRDFLLHSVLPNLSMIVHPARIDWSPFAIIEALAVGLPAVATAVGALPEMIQPNLNGVLLDSYDDEALITAIRTVHRSNSLGKLSRASRRLYESRFQAESLYKSLVKEVEQQPL